MYTILYNFFLFYIYIPYALFRSHNIINNTHIIILYCDIRYLRRVVIVSAPEQLE